MAVLRPRLKATKPPHDMVEASGRVTKPKLTKPKPRTATKQEQCPFMRLPGELRNVIYDLLLVQEDVIHVRGLLPNCKKERQDPASSRSSWREPAILTASKLIRLEAAEVYYQSNDFRLELSSTEFSEACWWIQSVANIAGQRPFLCFQMHVHTPQWHDLEKMLPLARLFFDDDIELVNDRHTEVREMRWTGHGYAEDVVRVDSIFSSERKRFREALDEVVKLGQTARQEDWHEQTLELEFGVWVDKMRETTYYKSSERAKKSFAKLIAQREAEYQAKLPWPEVEEAT